MVVKAAKKNEAAYRWRGTVRAAAMALVLGWGLAAQGSHAAVPASVSYQGQLTHTGGGPLAGPVQLQFRLYDAATGGAPLWEEAHPAVALAAGVFSVQLGSMAPLALPFDRPYYLGVSVNGAAEMAPRTPLSSAPYALSAKTVADGAVTAAKIGQVCAVGETLLQTASGWACGAATGPQGPAGAAGPIGPIGPAGPTGAAGTRALIAMATEAVGAHCATGGTRVQGGSDANNNGALDAGEVEATAYVCNGAQGPQGAAGPQGPAGPAGGGAGTLVHGCFSVGQAGSGAGYTVAYDGGTGQHVLSFTTPFASAGYTLLLDARAAPTGRARAVHQAAKAAGSVALALGWLDSAETAQPVCFVAAQ